MIYDFLPIRKPFCSITANLSVELFSVVILTRLSAIESALGGPTLGRGYSPPLFHCPWLGVLLAASKGTCMQYIVVQRTEFCRGTTTN